jgi:TPR repeat protein
MSRQLICVAGALFASALAAQTPAARTDVVPTVTQPAAPASALAAPATSASTQASERARFVEDCQQLLDRGDAAPGCQGPTYGNELSRLKEEALRTNDPTLLTLLGDAYQSSRGALSDVGQAYRWYLLAAVRGDPRAMQRLTELHRDGRGAPQDRVKALGYSRLAQKLAVPGSKIAEDAAKASGALVGEMAAQELALAERFAGELEATVKRQGATAPVASATPTGDAQTLNSSTPWQSGITLRERSRVPGPVPGIPGMTTVPPAVTR